MITVTLANGEVVQGTVHLAEYEPLRIDVRTSHGVAVRPEVRLDGVAIGQPDVSLEGDGLRWSWIFRPESWCGRSNLRIISDGLPRDVPVHSVPSGTKFTIDEYDRMLERVLSYGGGLAWGLSAGKGTGAAGGGERLHAIHPILIERHLGSLLSQLARILKEPVQASRPAESVGPIRQSRPVTPRDVRWLAARPDRLRELRSGDPGVVARLLVRRDAYDHPANRYVVTLLRRLRKALTATSTELARFGSRSLLDDHERQKAAELARRAAEAADRLSAALRHPVLAALEPGDPTESVALVFAGHPAYGRFGHIAGRILDPAVRLDASGDLEASLKRSWDLFEIYCLFRLCEVLEAGLGCDWTFARAPMRHHVLSTPPEGAVWRARHPDGRERILHYQRWFGQGGDAHSLSTARRPDFVLTAMQDGRVVSWIMMDAKYRSAAASINDALASMHVYRDSLRWRAADGARLTASGGYLLVPTVSAECARYGAPAFAERHGFGLIRIDDTDALQELLAR